MPQKSLRCRRGWSFMLGKEWQVIFTSWVGFHVRRVVTGYAYVFSGRAAFMQAYYAIQAGFVEIRRYSYSRATRMKGAI